MTQSNDTRAATIKKLLNKAEARGVTDAERDAYNAKAAELMVTWGIEAAMIADADRAVTEEIITALVDTIFPKGYSYEGSLIAVEIANALQCRGFLRRRSDGRTSANVVGFASDVELVKQLAHSLNVQAAAALEREMKITTFPSYFNGSDKFNFRRSFVRGFALSAAEKLAATRRQVVEETGPGTDLVLVQRQSRVSGWVDANMRIGSSRPRIVSPNGVGAGHAAGQRADVGQSKMGGSSRGITA